MSAVVHFGADLKHSLVLSKAGYDVTSYGFSLDAFEKALRSAEVEAALISCDNPKLVNRAVATVRLLSSAPVIVFEAEAAGQNVDADLLIPRLTSPDKWLIPVESLIQRCRELRTRGFQATIEARRISEESRDLQTTASQLRADSRIQRNESKEIRDTSRVLRKRSRKLTPGSDEQ
jgi:hypothetical protein